MSWLDFALLGNTARDCLISVCWFIVLLAALRIFKFVIIKKFKLLAKLTKTDLDDLAVHMLDSFNWPFFVLMAAYFSFRGLVASFQVQAWLDYAFLGIVVLYAVHALLGVVDYLAKKIIRRHDGESNSMMHFLANMIKAFLWLFAALLILSNVGINVTSLIAGLGIGGIAIALALQNVLGDLFASVSIFFDKPFKVGDFIIIGEHLGVVRYIGVKTTRIESLWGEEIVISNSELTSTRIRNFKKMEKRRIHFTFGIVYQTPPKKVRAVGTIIRDIFRKIKLADLDRVHFHKFGDSSLDFEVAYYVNTGDYNKYMDVQQEINFALLESFRKAGISFAYPTRTVFLEK